MERKKTLGANTVSAFKLSSLTGVHLRKANGFVNGTLYFELDGNQNLAGFTEMVNDPNSFSFRVGDAAKQVYALVEILEAIAEANRQRLGLEKSEHTSFFDRGRVRTLQNLEDTDLRSDVKEQARKYNVLKLKLLIPLNQHLKEDEVLEYLAEARYQRGRGIAAVTDRRFFVVQDNELKVVRAEIARSDIKSVKWKAKDMGKVQIFGTGGKITVEAIHEARKLVAALHS